MLFQTVILTCITGITFGEKASAIVDGQPTDCPGLYCGRRELDDGGWSDCMACPRGFQPNDQYMCSECNSSPGLYDWLYLGFMAILSVMLHFFFIDYTNVKKNSLIVLHLSALAESATAAILTLLLSEPLGSLHLTSCPVNRLTDWYSMLYNPSPNYTTTLHCTQEIVYPLYTIVMIYYAFSLLFLMCVRPLLSMKFVECKGTKSIYAALYFLPILIVIQAVLGGLLYYSFPYILIIASLITSAIHMANSEQQSYTGLLKENFKNIRSLVILIGHWLLLSYGIISLYELEEPQLGSSLSVHLPLLLLVFFPVFFYIGTANYTHPENLDKTE